LEGWNSAVELRPQTGHNLTTDAHLSNSNWILVA